MGIIGRTHPGVSDYPVPPRQTNKLKRALLLAACIFIAGISGYCRGDEHIRHISKYLSELSRDEYFSLSIAIAKDDRVVFEDAYGYANREHRIPNQTDTRYNIASIGKMFTAVAVLQLLEQHKIDLNEKVGKYLPDFPHKGIRDSVTIHQLLTHTGGLPLWFSPDFDALPKASYRELNDYLPLVRTVSINRKKAGSFAYSNVGYFVLGYIIEAVSGKSYPDYLRKSVFDPLQMGHTGIWPLAAIIPNVATGYNRPGNKTDWWKTNVYKNLGGGPAGGAYASAPNLLAFFNGLRSNTLLQASTVDLMFRPKVTAPFGEYGYGAVISEHNGHPVIGHSGEYYGIRGELQWYKDERYTVAILANSDQTDYDDISYFIRTELTGSPEEQKACEHTRSLLQEIKGGQFEVTEASCRKIAAHKYDESLIGIKAYYYLNNNDFDHAIQLFRLNTFLFPDSENAKADLVRGKQKQAG